MSKYRLKDVDDDLVSPDGPLVGVQDPGVVVSDRHTESLYLHASHSGPLSGCSWWKCQSRRKNEQNS